MQGTFTREKERVRLSTSTGPGVWTVPVPPVPGQVVVRDSSITSRLQGLFIVRSWSPTIEEVRLPTRAKGTSGGSETKGSVVNVLQCLEG